MSETEMGMWDGQSEASGLLTSQPAKPRPALDIFIWLLIRLHDPSAVVRVTGVGACCAWALASSRTAAASVSCIHSKAVAS